MSKTYPINEVYGPVIQGEGPQIGTRTFFVRFAGCDYDCSWCDTKYAVSPKYEGWEKHMLPASEIVDRLISLGAKAHDWITLSGGNPALFVDCDFTGTLANAYFRMAMETQGSVILKPLVTNDIDSLVVSPKPPSSGMHEKYKYTVLHRLLTEGRAIKLTALKYVVFDSADLDWIKYVEKQLTGLQHVQRFLQPGTDQNVHDTTQAILAKLSWLIDTVKDDRDFAAFRILAQQHALLYGLRRGV